MQLELGGRATLLLLALLSIPVLCDNHHGTKPGQDRALKSLLPNSPEACESRTINYITHTLPQQCLRTSWTSQAPSVGPTTVESASAAISTDASISNSDKNVTEGAADGKGGDEADEKEADKQALADTHEEQEDLATSSFMSFEEWKEMMLRKSGQDPAEIKAHKQPHREHKTHRDSGDGPADLDSFGDDGEISIDFDALSDKVSELTAAKSGGSTPETSVEAREEQVLLDDGKMQYYRSKDAGKTCKERFSYSSFDAGATILKTSPGAKNAKSILVENKDSYMLLECHAKNKFVIVELSDDILVDTVVLANFEFFSSMIRQFRVSVSDRYPVKMDKWVELGTFEARNSRDIQAFLVEHPQIYTKYLRVEFLTHYGNEYYCPVSLLRVHGTRMLDSWKEPDTGHDEDEAEATVESTPEEQVAESGPQETEQPTAQTPQSADTMEQPSVPKPENTAAASEVSLNRWLPVFEGNFSTGICNVEPLTTELPTPVTPSSVSAHDNSSASVAAPQTSTQVASPSASTATGVPASEESLPVDSSSSSTRQPNSAPPPAQSTDSTASNSTPAVSLDAKAKPQLPPTKADTTDTASSPPSVKASSSTSLSKNKTSTSSSASASPTVQESFFKTVTKRLQHLETNTSLSLQYIEEQSRFLQEALQKMEKRQISRVDAFLDSLNKTVFAELRNVRAQYDQIWQSTVIALESQRDQAQRETVALSDRLSLLADEVVFQKRMAILQSVLLLAALVLVIFSRGFYVNAPAADFYPPSSPIRHHNHMASLSAPALVDTPGLSPQLDDLDPDGGESSAAPSPSPARAGSFRQSVSRSGSYRDKDLPLTPLSKSAASSIYSREPTPAINVEDVDTPFFHDRASNGSDIDYTTPPKKQREDASFPENSEMSDSVEWTSSGNISGRTGGEDEDFLDGIDVTGQVQEQLPRNPRRSATSQLGSGRKPLPALPEDVPDDQDHG